MEFSKKIRGIRKNRQMSQQEFADLLHVSRSTISSWETGKKKPDIYTFSYIAEQLHVPIEAVAPDDFLILSKKEEMSGSLKKRDYNWKDYTCYVLLLLEGIEMISFVITQVLMENQMVRLCLLCLLMLALITGIFILRKVHTNIISVSSFIHLATHILLFSYLHNSYAEGDRFLLLMLVLCVGCMFFAFITCIPFKRERIGEKK